MPVKVCDDPVELPPPFIRDFETSDAETVAHLQQLHGLHERLIEHFRYMMLTHTGVTESSSQIDQPQETMSFETMTGTIRQKSKKTPWLPDGPCQLKVFSVCEGSDSSHSGNFFAIVTIFVIVLSCLGFIIETLPEFTKEDGKTPEVFVVIDMACVMYFTLEFLLRIITVPFVDTKELIVLGYSQVPPNLSNTSWLGSFVKLRIWCCQVMNIIDLLSILPFWINLIVGDSTNTASTSFLRALRLSRIFRVFKFGRFSRSIYVVPMVIQQSAYSIFLMGFILMMMAVLFGSIMYLIEGGRYDDETSYYMRTNLYGDGEERTPFLSIPHAMWWFMVTTTTLGYGDMYPTTDEGKIFAVVAMYLGILIIAMPLAIISRNFDVVTSKARTEDHIRMAIQQGQKKEVNLENYVMATALEVAKLNKLMSEVVEGEEEEEEEDEEEEEEAASATTRKATATTTTTTTTTTTLAVVRNLNTATDEVLSKKKKSKTTSVQDEDNVSTKLKDDREEKDSKMAIGRLSSMENDHFLTSQDKKAIPDYKGEPSINWEAAEKRHSVVLSVGTYSKSPPVSPSVMLLGGHVEKAHDGTTSAGGLTMATELKPPNRRSSCKSDEGKTMMRSSNWNEKEDDRVNKSVIQMAKKIDPKCQLCEVLMAYEAPLISGLKEGIEALNAAIQSSSST